jgi:peptide/nickel transport system substrate-binding protein
MFKRCRPIYAVGAALLCGAFMLTVPSLGTAASQTKAAKSSTPYANINLTISTNAFGPQADNLNPFLPTSTDNASDANTDMIYEPLWQYDVVKPTTTYPWLATAYSLTNNDEVLNLTLRKNVTWSDGKPFSSADVVETFSLLKKYPALNTNGITFSQVTAEGAYGVKMTFSRPSFAELYYILNQTPIVSHHIWSTVKNPVSYPDTNPIGTGPFTLKSFTPEYMVLQRNPHYWQHGLPEVNSITYPAVGSAGAQNAAFNEGDYTWSSATEPDIQRLYVAKSPYNKYWYPPVGITALLPNDAVYPLNIEAVRRAISLVVNRKSVSTLGEWGYESPISTATGLILPNYQSFLAPQYANTTYATNVAQARSLLKGAGFKFASNGDLLGKNGKAISLSLIDPSSWTDYMADCSVVAVALKSIGIGSSVQGLSVGTWTSDLATGQFNLALYYSNTGPQPYYIFNAWLNDTLTAPIGSAAGGDQGRWKDPATQKYLNAYLNATTDAARNKAMYGIEGIMVNQLPVIPLVYSIDWGAYRTNVVTGWPTPQNPYSSAGPIEPANQEFVILHLHPVSK